MKLLRFFTAGNVDDGKSTLIGRLLYDSNSISNDIIETLMRQSKINESKSTIDFALLTDGLRAEREQGITIDVAYKYFTTEKRKFIVADTPGHVQYTRNMFTGASNTDLAIILIDARNGITDQTKRHSILLKILRIPHVVICVNKMDLINYSEKRYKEIESDYLIFAELFGLKNVSFIPVSALIGDNIVKRSGNIHWYKGPALLEFLETVELTEDRKSENSRFQVQYVIRHLTNEYFNYRGYAGKVLNGSFKKGEKVLVLPSNIETEIEKIEKNQREVELAEILEPIIIYLKDKIDINRGDTIVPINKLPRIESKIYATLCWMDNAPFQPGQKLILQQNSYRTKAVLIEVIGKIDIHTFEQIRIEGEIKLNDIIKVLVKTAEPLCFDSYKINRSSGAFILIDENTNNTVAAGVVD